MCAQAWQPAGRQCGACRREGEHTLTPSLGWHNQQRTSTLLSPTTTHEMHTGSQRHPGTQTRSQLSATRLEGSNFKTTSVTWLSGTVVASDHCAEYGPSPGRGLMDRSKWDPCRGVLESSFLKGGNSPKQKQPLLEVSHVNTATTWSESCPEKQIVRNAIAQACSLISLDWGHGDFYIWLHKAGVTLPSPLPRYLWYPRAGQGTLQWSIRLDY